MALWTTTRTPQNGFSTAMASPRTRTPSPPDNANCCAPSIEPAHWNGSQQVSTLRRVERSRRLRRITRSGIDDAWPLPPAGCRRGSSPLTRRPHCCSADRRAVAGGHLHTLRRENRIPQAGCAGDREPVGSPGGRSHRHTGHGTGAHSPPARSACQPACRPGRDGCHAPAPPLEGGRGANSHSGPASIRARPTSPLSRVAASCRCTGASDVVG